MLINFEFVSCQPIPHIFVNTVKITAENKFLLSPLALRIFGLWVNISQRVNEQNEMKNCVLRVAITLKMLLFY